MPKVLRIINRFNLGGPTYNAAYLTKYMAPEFETLLIGGDKDETEDSSKFIINELGLHTITISEMKRAIDFKNDVIAYNKIKAIIKRYKPDIVHTHASKAGTLGRMAAFSCNVKVVVHTFHGHVFHSYFNKGITSFYKNIERRLANKTSRIIALSEKQKDELSNIHKICASNKISIVPLGFDLTRFQENKEIKRKLFRDKYQISDDEIAIGIIGRLVPIKNHKLFLDSLNYVLNNTRKKVRAFIVGDGEEKNKIMNLAKQLDICFIEKGDSNTIAPLTFTSWIKEIDHVNAGMDIVVLTSLNEGTPVSLIEAQASNKPIVTTNVGGIENVVSVNQTAFLSEKGDYISFAKNLFLFTENDKLRSEMGEKGWDFVKEKFHYSRLVNDMKEIYY